MDARRWAIIESLYDTALAKEPGERSKYLADACREYPELQAEVESLLRCAGEELNSPLEDCSATPTFLGDVGFAQARVGDKLGPYEIIGAIGAGGMGQVYRAHDPRMGRDVALKISAERVSDLFSREVRAVAALNHPNICQLYDVGPNYLVMELVEGLTLAERIKQSPIPLEEALAIARQIVEALDAAHRKGVIHHDLKPANIMVTPEGSVKLLDFGLAKQVTSSDQTATMEGAVRGTPPYMAPEQAEGKAVDARSDVFSFGAVLYELLSGRRAFQGLSAISTIAAILFKEPALLDAPPAVEQIVKRCLAKVPGNRYQTAAELRVALESISGQLQRLIGSVPRQPSVAVMPFVNQTSDPENEYFCDGLTDELIRTLSRIEGLRVAARGVVSRYANETFDLKQAGREIGVDTVLEGSVQRVATKIRVSVHMVNVGDGFEIWADRFDSDWKDVFAIQDSIAEAVAEALKARLGMKPPGHSTRNAEAYTAFLRGQHLVKRHTTSNLQRGLEYFQEAIRLDPEYALPYHGAALHYILGALMGDVDPRHALPTAEDLLSHGLTFDTESAWLQNTLGMLRMLQWRWTESEQAYLRAITIEPANSYPHMMYAQLCSFLGRHDEASRQATKALELDPLDPMTNFRVVHSLYYARRYEEAVQKGRTAIELARDFLFTHWYVALALLALGRQPEAWALIREKGVLDVAQPLNLGHFGYIAGVTGHAKEALALIEEVKARRAGGYSPALQIAWTYLGLSDYGHCLDWLQTAAAGHEPYLGCIAVFPGHDPLREHSAFIELVHRIMADARRLRTVQSAPD